MVVFLFWYSYSTMKNADSEYLCKDLQIQQRFNEIKDKLERVEEERYQVLDKKVNEQQIKIDALFNKK